MESVIKGKITIVCVYRVGYGVVLEKIFPVPERRTNRDLYL